MRRETLTNYGVKMRVDSHDSLRLIKNRIYERAETEIIAGEMGGHPWQIFLDIGAHIGYHSLVAWKAQRNKGAEMKGTIFAFEPDPENFQILKENIFINTAEEIGAVNMAITNKTGEEDLYLNPLNSGDHRVYEVAGRERIRVKTSRLDDLDFIEWGKVGLVKIDTQGAEMRVLTGASKMLAQNNFKMIVEFYPAGLEAAGTTGLQLLLAIRKAGFLIREIVKATGMLNKIDDCRDDMELSFRYSAAGGRHCNLFCERP